nr:coiled-coil domain-containing protein 83 [Anolis sagrei ordinatus]
MPVLKEAFALKNAVKHIDKISRREINEHDWLKEEVAAYRRDVSDLEASIYELEKENIYLINKLFDRKLQFLKVPRKLFLTQGAGLHIPGKDWEDLDFANWASLSEFVLAVEGKPSEEKKESEEEEEIKEDDVVHLRGEAAYGFLPPILYEDSNDFKAYQDLGSLEVKLMTAVGQAMPIHSKSELETTHDSSRPDTRITYQMIKSIFP